MYHHLFISEIITLSSKRVGLNLQNLGAHVVGHVFRMPLLLNSSLRVWVPSVVNSMKSVFSQQ